MSDGPESVAEVAGTHRIVVHAFHVAREDGVLCDACGVHAQWVLDAQLIGPLCAICSDNLAHAMTV